MIQRCPECGQWCEVEKNSALDRYRNGANEVAEAGAEILGAFAGLFGDKTRRLGENLGRLGGAAVGGNLIGIGEAIFGDSFTFICPTCGHSWSCDSEEEDQSGEYYRIQEIHNSIRKIYNLDLDNQSLVLSYICEIDNIIPQVEDRDTLSTLYDVRAVAHWALNQFYDALSDISQSLRLFDDPHSRAIKGVIQFDIYLAAPDGKKILEAVKNLLSIYDERHEVRYLNLDFLEKKLESAISEYVKIFPTLNPAERRFICFSDQVQSMGQHILVLPLGRIPEHLTFPDGLPRKNVIYEVHPFKPNHYLSLDSFEFDLFRDKIAEFQWIMENLGARSLNIQVASDRSHNHSAKDDVEIGGEVEYKGIRAKAGYGKATSDDKYMNLKQSVEENCHFLISEQMPKLPDDKELVWYPHSKDWQLKVESRLKGRTERFEISMCSKSDYSINSNLAQSLEAEMEYLMARGKAKYETSTDYKISISENHIWRVSVEFYPLSSYIKKESQEIKAPISSTNVLTQEEQEYLEIYREYMSVGKLTGRERKLLAKISSQAGLTEERVTQLEAMIEKPKKKTFLEKLFS